MTDLDTALAAPDVAGTTSAAAGRRCKVGRTLDTVETGQAARILHLLHLPADDPDEPGWTDDILAKQLERGGQRISTSQLSRHRNRVCICTEYETDDK